MRLEVFGAQLLKAGDLDPVYTMLAKSSMDADQKRRWCFAYWCCYHAGASSYLSEFTGVDFWIRFMDMAANVNPPGIVDRWPRGAERRHFRGKAAVDAAIWYQGIWERPEDAVKELEIRGPQFAVIRKQVMTWPQFGPWIAFKVGDMLERCLNTPVDFSASDIFVFDAPSEAAALWHLETSGYTLTTSAQAVAKAADHLRIYLAEFLAPPTNDRPLGLQEFETILCKWKSHQSGNYPIGKDTLEITHGLADWSLISKTAEHLFSTFRT